MSAPSADWCSARGPDLLLRLRIQTRSSREGIDGVQNGRLRVRIGAPPVEGAANNRLVEVLAEALKLPRSAFRIAHGAKSRDKDVLVAGAAARRDELLARLFPAVP